MIERATATDKMQGRSKNNRASFVESIMVLIVDSPKPTIRNAPSRRQQVKCLGMKWSTGNGTKASCKSQGKKKIPLEKRKRIDVEPCEKKKRLFKNIFFST
jgi:hypothetical protein